MPDKYYDCSTDGHEWIKQDTKQDRAVVNGQRLVTIEEVYRCRICEAIKRVWVGRPVGATKLRYWFDTLSDVSEKRNERAMRGE